MEPIYAKAAIWKAIRKKCISCGDGTFKGADNCKLKQCELWPYRFGKPDTSGKKRKYKQGE